MKKSEQLRQDARSAESMDDLEKALEHLLSGPGLKKQVDNDKPINYSHWTPELLKQIFKNVK